MRRRAGLAVMLVALAVAPLLADDIRLFQLTNILIYAIALLGVAGVLARLTRRRMSEWRP